MHLGRVTVFWWTLYPKKDVLRELYCCVPAHRIMLDHLIRRDISRRLAIAPGRAKSTARGAYFEAGGSVQPVSLDRDPPIRKYDVSLSARQ